jgi:hypothetical protein
VDDMVPVMRDEHRQQPVPTDWRPTLKAVADAFAVGGPLQVPKVRPISPECALSATKNVANYGATLVRLPEEAWRTSVCQWMRSYWDVLVDLYTAEEGSSDLVLAVRVFELGADFEFEVESIHVP